MKRTTAWLVLGFAISCGKTDEPRQAPEPVPASAPAPVAEPPPAPTPPPRAEPPPAPEPTTPEEIDQARKQAMIDGRERDVIKYCELAGVDPKKTDPQVLLGCALAACRVNEVEKARTWSKPLPKALKDQAIKICMANQVAL